MISRREFLGWAGACGLTAAASRAIEASSPRALGCVFAPHAGTFRCHAGLDVVDQIHFAADSGFRAFEDCGLRAKSPAEQLRIGEALAHHRMTAGAIPGVIDFGQPTFAGRSRSLRRDVQTRLHEALSVAQRVGGRLITLVLGKVAPGVTPAEQWKNTVELLRICAEACDHHDAVILLEPIDHRVGSSRLLLQSVERAAWLARAVPGGRCRVLLDVYQVAMSGRNLAETVRSIGDVLGYVQIADGPGRKEPGTGVINFPHLFAALDAIGYGGTGYGGVLAMEHGQSMAGIEGERAVLAAYRRLATPRIA